MKKYNSINDLSLVIEKDLSLYNGFNKEIMNLLELLETINPCEQEYELINNNIIISYILKINLFNFKEILPLRVKVQIIGLPISISEKGYWGEVDSIVKAVAKRKGLKIFLNGKSEFKNGGRTLSTFIFENKYSSFNGYLNALRSPYRRRINKALKHRSNIEIRQFSSKDFNKNHYKLYLSIMNRTTNPLETLPLEFFTDFDAELYEFIDIETKDVIGFIQLKEINDKLCFLFGGFKKVDNFKYDIYYNMLLKIIEIGIEKQIKFIEFGQTAEECKLKIGCKEVPKYMYVHHSNPLLNKVIQKLVPLFSYKPYSVEHHVFKQN